MPNPTKSKKKQVSLDCSLPGTPQGSQEPSQGSRSPKLFKRCLERENLQLSSNQRASALAAFRRMGDLCRSPKPLLGPGTLPCPDPGNRISSSSPLSPCQKVDRRSHEVAMDFLQLSSGLGAMACFPTCPSSSPCPAWPVRLTFQDPMIGVLSHL